MSSTVGGRIVSSFGDEAGFLALTATDALAVAAVRLLMRETRPDVDDNRKPSPS